MGPIIRALTRHKVIVALIVIEVALCFALMASGGALLAGKLSPMYRLSLPSESGHLYVVDPGDAPSSVEETEEGQISLAKEDLYKLSGIYGVSVAGQINSIPVGGQMQSASISARSQKVAEVENVAVYLGTPNGLRSLGAELVAGRNLKQEDITPYASGDSALLGRSVLITASLSRRLFGQNSAIGKALFYGDNGSQRAIIVGVIQDISKPILANKDDSEFSVIRAVDPFPGGLYLLRSSRHDVQSLKESISAVLSADAPGRTNITVKTLGEISADYFKSDRALAELLATVILAVIAVCLIGVSGITSYWIRQRHKSVGIRRALGANKRQIFGEFVAESVMISTTGVLIGMLVYFAASKQLVSRFGLPSLRISELILLGIAFELVCVAAVIRSISVAASLQPVEATRL